MEALAAATAPLQTHPPSRTHCWPVWASAAFAELLAALGSNERGPLPAVATMLAAAVGAAVPSGRGGRCGRDGPRRGPSARRRPLRRLRRSSRGNGGGAAGGAVRSVVVRARDRRGVGAPDAAPRARAGDRCGTRRCPGGPAAGAVDPVGVTMDLLADSGDAAASAALLGAEDVWQALLARFWNDGGTALGQVIAAAAAEPGPDGPRAVRLGSRGHRRQPFRGRPQRVGREPTDRRRRLGGHRPRRREPDRRRRGCARPSAPTAGWASRREVLRGLAYVSLDRTAAAAVEVALEGEPSDLPSLVAVDSPSALPAVTVPAAFLAVQEYGQRLTNALDGFAAKRRAENVEFLWNWTFALPTTVAGESPAALRRRGLRAGRGLRRHPVGADGTWDDPVDRGCASPATTPPTRRAPGGNSGPMSTTLAQQARASLRPHRHSPRPAGPTEISRGRPAGPAQGRCDGRGRGSGEGSAGTAVRDVGPSPPRDTFVSPVR